LSYNHASYANKAFGSLIEVAQMTVSVFHVLMGRYALMRGFTIQLKQMIAQKE